MGQSKFRELIVGQFRTRVFEENYSRIYKCLDMISEEQVWWAPNEHLNSIGHLILHLEGNARQWILSGLGSAQDTRDRAREFSTDERISKSELRERMDALRTDIEKQLTKIEDVHLFAVRRVQIYEEPGLSILVHVIEHFSYHTGQIACLTKLMLNEALGFYDESKL